MQWRSLILVALMSHGWIPENTILGDDEGSRDYLIAGMRAEREKLRTGYATLLGEHVIESWDIKNFRVPVRYEIAFDYDSKSFRYTQHDFAPNAVPLQPPKYPLANPNRPDMGQGKTPDGRDWVAQADGGSVVLTPEYDLHRSIESNHVTRLAPGNLRSTSVREWDVSAFGMIDWPVFHHGMRRDEIFEAMKSNLMCHSVEVDSSGISRMKLRSDDTEYETWIDEKNGMTPIRISRKDLRQSMRETSRSDVSWKLINEVWVPVTFRIEDLEGGQSYALVIEWKDVNQPLNPDVFTPKGITDGNGTVADMRLGTGILERVHPIPLPTLRPQIQPIVPKSYSQLIIVVVTNVVLVSIAWWFYRRRRKLQSNA